MSEMEELAIPASAGSARGELHVTVTVPAAPSSSRPRLIAARPAVLPEKNGFQIEALKRSLPAAARILHS